MKHVIHGEYRVASIEYGTERPCEIARLVDDGDYITLAYRYTDDESQWFPTWIGRIGEAVKVPKGFKFNAAWIERINALPQIAEVGTL